MFLIFCRMNHLLNVLSLPSPYAAHLCPLLKSCKAFKFHLLQYCRVGRKLDWEAICKRIAIHHNDCFVPTIFSHLIKRVGFQKEECGIELKEPMAVKISYYGIDLVFRERWLMQSAKQWAIPSRANKTRMSKIRKIRSHWTDKQT